MGSKLESNSTAVRKRIESHTFDNEEGEEYEPSKFGGFPEYFRRKKIKLQNLDAELRAKSADKPAVFRGVVANVNGYTQPSLNDLHRMIVEHGGGFMQYLTGKTAVTHIIASSLTPKKAVEFKKYRIVKPAWVVDSIAAGKLLPWDAYRVVDEGVGQKILGFDSGKIVSQTSKQSKGYRDQSDTSWYTSQLKQSASTPSSSRPKFRSQRPPTPVSDDIDGEEQSDPDDDVKLREAVNYDVPEGFFDGATPNTPPKTSPVEETPQRELIPEVDKSTESRTPGEKVRTPSIRAHKRSRSPSADAAAKRPRWTSEQSGALLDSPSKRSHLTAEEHNAILLADPKVRKSSVINPEFLEQYYRESRLHHLSTWKADLKSQLQTLAAEKTSSQRVRQKRAPGARRYILHVDFDSFFAAVSLKKHPEYKEKPAVVAHGNGTGSEIASCNYPARKYGIKNGMWMKRALELFPDLKVLPYDFPAYEEASRSFYQSIMNCSPEAVVQSVSIDEALVDVSNSCNAAGGGNGVHPSKGALYREQEQANEIATRLRDEVLAKTGCNVSVGIGANILLAKVALRKAKPAGQYQIKPDEMLDFVGALQVQDLPGVAWSIGGKLEEIGIKFVSDIRQVTKEKLVNALGPKTGEKLWDYSRGIDRSEVGDVVVRKSVSAEVNWGVRFENQEQTDEFIENLCGELNKRLLKERVKGRQFTMKIMRRAADAPLDPPKHLGHGKCDTYNKSIALGVATNAKEVLTKEALSILKSFNISPGELRGIGVQMTKLEPLRANLDGKIETSQRRLQFKTHNAVGRPLQESVSDEPDAADDSIQDDVVTPKKPKAPPKQINYGPADLHQSTPRKKPLNTLGTQFILPSQVDPTVLEELPSDIRAKLARHVRQASPSPAARPRPPASTVLPSESQLDPEALSALPDDLRAEVLAHYAQDLEKLHTGEHAGLPQSPQKTRIFAPPKKPVVPVKRGRGRPPKYAIAPTSAATSNATSSTSSTLTQANFITSRPTSRNTDALQQVNAADVDVEFLAALPASIRAEVLAQQRLSRLNNKSALTLPRKAPPRPKAPVTLLPSQRTLVLPPRKPRPTFTTQKFTSIENLRTAISSWWDTFSDEGPYDEDVGALGKYLSAVVRDEMDMHKAMKVVQWLAWVVSEGYEQDEGTVEDSDGFAGLTASQEKGKLKWEGAVETVKVVVRKAVKERGLGEIDF
ncbi:DNA repair protein [Pseudovirgaria hyperparasitica]|uniref:DNA repair protein REV1 n=1 Tax=Pseudovirgaria hyperparasitica TaxID=470096 RepID=A0A6A6VUS1_9PEZI|nr:DNA repair protein [Pseudovirgaria hyperparasitica]KAF2753629.1 DNA repair protein [Pseudovirgaria hyperparasitica]